MTSKINHVKVQLEKELYNLLLEVKQSQGLRHDTEAIRLCIKTAHKQLLKKEVKVPA